MPILTQIEFARQCGITRQTVRGSLLKGNLVPCTADNGPWFDARNGIPRINTKHGTNAAYLERCKKENFSKLTQYEKKKCKDQGVRPKDLYPHKTANPNEGKKKADHIVTRKDVAEMLGNPNFEEPNFGEQQGPGLTKAEADRLKTIEQYEKARLDNEQKRGNLIDRDLVSQVISEFNTVDVQELLPIATNFPSVALGICGKEDLELEHKMEVKLRKLIYNVLEHKKRIMDDFLEGLKK
jgi:hypothetical protein